ncbi:MAG: DUF1573 domain-containing protein [Candidatus Omnitrophica bacterium]|nr:DUF1573 domain-containing protein [Candidatus Omnitrophota bacterium]
MARIIFAFLLLFFFVPQTGCFSQGQKEQPPQAAAQKTENPDSWDFGEVNQGDIVTHEFIVTNTTKKMLNIKDVNSSCGCTVSAIKKRILAPGESAVLEVKFNSRGYYGWAQQYVYVHTDNTDNPLLRFIIRANVLPPLKKK